MSGGEIKGPGSSAWDLKKGIAVSARGRHRLVLSMLIFASLIMSPGCGYHLRGGGNNLPEDVRRVALLSFENRTYDAEIEQMISSALSTELSKSSRLKVVPEMEADAILTGTVNSITDRPVSFSAGDVASEYRLSVSLDAVLKRTEGDEVIWKGKAIGEIADYRSIPGDVEETERNRDEAMQKLAVDLAALVYDRLFEGF